MKKFHLICFLLITINHLALCQKIPSPQIDSANISDHEFPAGIDFSGFDEYIVYTNYSSWTKDHVLCFLGSKQGTWESSMYIVDYKTDHYTTQKEFKIKKKKVRVKQTEVDSLLSYFNTNHFWPLKDDSLFQRERKINDSLSEVLVVTDGSADVFYISSAKTRYIISAYMVDYYQKLIPNRSKSIFILCRTRFIAMFYKNRN